ncbi:hypothetical protein PQC18_gp69 [Streptomyces phage Pablito]|uniref:Phage ABA sandwich domain-containing protein n=1 Tax=Streptomyces phage Pablito TaxID=2894593 RepID=A0AAE8YFY3_9CAUD|nr:hypothetical protein PQC18_gp69 [Streptomyces phage Pablito]UFD98007.1 hypothetical protein [Streptomyces phage Pablito]
MPSIEEIQQYVTDQVAADIVEIAAYGGITYWATEPNEEEFAGLPEGKTWTIVEGIDDTGWGGDREVDAVHYLNTDDIREAYTKLLDLNQQIVGREIHGYIVQSWIDRNEKDGIDAGHIDADAADAIIQIACLDELRYG